MDSKSFFFSWLKWFQLDTYGPNIAPSYTLMAPSLGVDWFAWNCVSATATSRHLGPSCWTNTKWPKWCMECGKLRVYLVRFTAFLRLRKWWKRTDMHRTRVCSFRRIFCLHDIKCHMLHVVSCSCTDVKATFHYLGSDGGLICFSWCKEQLEVVSDISWVSLVR